MNFITLQGKVASWINRTDLTAQIPDFINLAIKGIEQDWNYKCMEYRLTTTTSDAYITMPAKYKEPKWFAFITGGRYIMLEKDSTEQSISSYPDIALGVGMPVCYSTMTSQNEFLIRPTPDASYTFEGIFYRYTDDLVADVDSNWWTENAWDTVLYGALLAAAPFLGDDGRIMVWEKFYGSAVKSLRDAETRENIAGSSPKTKSSYVV